MPDFWLDAKLLINAPDEATAKRLLDEVLQDWARRTADHGGPGLTMFDRTGLFAEETK